MSEFHVREAHKEDMPQIFNMIKALAEFEKMADQVKITTEKLIQDGFGANPAFGCFVATSSQEDNKILGYALYYNCYSTWVGKSIFLEDLFVLPEYRNHGIGKLLFLKVAELAYKSSKRMDLHVLAWNPAKEIYRSLGCTDLTLTEEWHTFRLDNKALDTLIDNNKSV